MKHFIFKFIICFPSCSQVLGAIFHVMLGKQHLEEALHYS